MKRSSSGQFRCSTGKYSCVPMSRFFRKAGGQSIQNMSRYTRFGRLRSSRSSSDRCDSIAMHRHSLQPIFTCDALTFSDSIIGHTQRCFSEEISSDGIGSIRFWGTIVTSDSSFIWEEFEVEVILTQWRSEICFGLLRLLSIIFFEYNDWANKITIN